MIRVFIHPKINANFIQARYSGFKTPGKIKAKIKKVPAMPNTGKENRPRLIKNIPKIKTKHAAIVKPNLLKTTLFNLIFSILVQLKNLTPLHILFKRLLFFLI